MQITRNHNESEITAAYNLRIPHSRKHAWTYIRTWLFARVNVARCRIAIHEQVSVSSDLNTHRLYSLWQSLGNIRVFSAIVNWSIEFDLRMDVKQKSFAWNFDHRFKCFCSLTVLDSALTLQHFLAPVSSVCLENRLTMHLVIASIICTSSLWSFSVRFSRWIWYLVYWVGELPTNHINICVYTQTCTYACKQRSIYLSASKQNLC